VITQTFRANPHGWIVVFVSFSALSVISATRASIGLVMPALEAELGWSRGFISSVAAWALVTMAVTAPFAGNMLDRYGPRFVFVTGLIVAGIGLCSSAVIDTRWQYLLSFALLAGVGYGTVAKSMVTATVGQYFEKDRGLAGGVAAGGSTAGQLALLPLLAVVLTSMGWRYGYIFLGACCFVLIPIVWVLIGDGAKRPPRAKDQSTEPLRARLGYLSGNRTFLLLLVSYTICGFTTAGVIETHLVPYVQSCGFPVVTSATAYSFLAGFNLLGMFVSGYLTDRMHRPLLLGTIYAMRGMAFILLMLVPKFDVTFLLFFAAVFGTFDYSTIPVTTSLVATHVGRPVMGLALGILGMFHSSGGALGAFFGGQIYDLFQRYDWIWLVSIGLALIAAVMAFCIVEKPQGESESLPEGAAPAAIR
jgi:MFS family permease